MKLVFLGGKGELTNAVYNALAEEHSFEKIIIEDPVPMNTFLKKRLRQIGLLKIMGQIGFKLLVVPYLKLSSVNRVADIAKQYHLSFENKYENSEIFFHTKSVNSTECINIIKNINPELIIVNGTRIISKEFLEHVSCKMINMHLGITPKYRGVHGAYWAFYNSDDENAGVTIHLIDKGIDTGGILFQSKIEITEQDNYYTYPYLQVGEGIKLELQAICDIEEQEMTLIKNGLPSRLYSHPGLLQYLYGRVGKKVK